jgi:hypothetical protein
VNTLKVDNGDIARTNARIARIQGSGGVLYER